SASPARTTRPAVKSAILELSGKRTRATSGSPPPLAFPSSPAWGKFPALSSRSPAALRLTCTAGWHRLRSLVATRDPSAVDAELAALVGELSRRAGRPVLEHEVRAALAPLSATQEAVLRATSPREPPAAPPGPIAWADIARGVSPQAAAARELSGYYTLLAERDALASMLEARSTPPPPAGPPPAPPAQSSEPVARPPPPPSSAAPPPSPRRVSAQPPPAEQPLPSRAAAKAVKIPVAARRKAPGQPGRPEQILGLFAYHRDAPLVARALSLSMAELESEIDILKI